MKNETTPNPEATAVLENQQAIASTNAAIATLENAISKCESQITQQQAALPDVGPLLSQRADLLAAMAIGEDKSADMKKLDAKLEKLNAQRNDAAPALDVLKQTIDGLSRRLPVARATLQSLQTQRSSLMRQFLLSRAETIGAEYFELAKKIVANYKQLRALDNLMQGSPLAMYGEGLNVPRFRLGSISSLMDWTWAQEEVFKSRILTQKESDEWERQETAALLEMGIVLKLDAMPLPVQSSAVAGVSAPAEGLVYGPFKGQRMVNPDLVSQR
ncbi:MAG: hypothetical protein FD135_3598 [Comamonadaceae bacterium]|nr:MAG: hypothetical protein FD135_3598 [Comamonadaceae bacterium]